MLNFSVECTIVCFMDFNLNFLEFALLNELNADSVEFLAWTLLELSVHKSLRPDRSLIYFLSKMIALVL